MTYEYLKPFTNSSIHLNKPRNAFYPIYDIEIKKAEKALDVIFPSELKQFYQEIGYGFLQFPEYYDEYYDYSFINRINPPSMIVDMVKNGHDSGLIDLDTFEMLEPGDLPVFEIGDSSSFMIMKAKSNNPNAVWYMGMEKIEDSFERFIWRLYHENPAYYSADWATEYQ